MTRATRGDSAVPELPLAGELAAVFGHVSDLVLSTETARTALNLVTALAKETVPGTVGAGVTVLDQDGARLTAAATDAEVERADELQYRLGHGPCLTAWEQRTVVRVDDLATDRRWPRWARAVTTATGLRAVLSAPVVAGSDTVGAVKVYAGRPGAYRERHEYRLTMFAAQAAVLLANARSTGQVRQVSGQLKEALRGRDLVSLAKGVLMARAGVDEQTAFVMLAEMAEERHTTLRETAAGIVRSAARPGG